MPRYAVVIRPSFPQGASPYMSLSSLVTSLMVVIMI